MRKYILLLILLSLSLIPQPRPVAAQGGEEAWMMEQLNALRAQSGRGALTWNGQLAAAAAAHSQVLATTPWVGPHIEANGSTPQSRAAAQGYGGRVGENVVGGGSANMQWAWNWWMNSATHVSNMLGDWNEVGIAVAVGSYGRFYTMVLGNNGSAAPAPPPPTNNGNQNQNQDAGGAQQVAVQRPTRPPPPTATPTITFTPSITFTPRATYTGVPSITPIGPTETPIVMELAPADTADTEPPLATATPESEAESEDELPSATSPAVAMVVTANAQPDADADTSADTGAAVQESTAATGSSVSTASTASTSSGVRGLLPVIMGVQALIVVGLAIRAALRRRR